MPDLPPPPPITRSRWALVVVILALAAISVSLLPPSSHGADAPSAAAEPGSMMAVAPGGTVDLAVLSDDHQALYRAAAADPEAFRAVACYCGCEAFLGHRHLLDCFVRPAGGWERHATGCAVCLTEARDVIELRDDGTPLDEIARTIDRRFGGITDPTTA